jgi:tetratricopeptide (TPR) repeat protein
VRGKWLLLEGTLEGAIRELTLARRLDGTSRQVLRLLGDAFWAAGRRDEAAEVYQEAIRVGGDDIPCHYQLGVYHYLRDEIEAALRRFAAVDADPAAHGVLPHVVMSQFYQARCQDRLDQGEPAIGHYRRFAEMTGEYRSSFRVMPELLRLMREPSLIPVYVARVQSRQGRLSAAAETLRKAIDAHPDWVLGHTELTRVHLLAGRGEEAMAVCRQIVRRAPADRDALQLAAEVFAAMGEGEQFLLLVKEVLEANPDQEALKKFHAEMVKRFGPRAASRPAEPSAGQP